MTVLPCILPVPTESDSAWVISCKLPSSTLTTLIHYPPSITGRQAGKHWSDPTSTTGPSPTDFSAECPGGTQTTHFFVLGSKDKDTVVLACRLLPTLHNRMRSSSLLKAEVLTVSVLYGVGFRCLSLDAATLAAYTVLYSDPISTLEMLAASLSFSRTSALPTLFFFSVSTALLSDCVFFKIRSSSPLL